MNTDVPYMASVTNLHKILDAMQRAAAPETFHLDFLRDLGFTSSNDRGAVKLFKFLGLLDGSGKPQSSYREFMDHAKAKQVLAAQLRASYDDLFKSDRQANAKTADSLKGWFKTKTGVGDAVAKKMATTFKSLATYADFNAPALADDAPENEGKSSGSVDSKEKDHASREKSTASDVGSGGGGNGSGRGAFGLVYRFEIHLPDTQNVDTFRAIFKALREELM